MIIDLKTFTLPPCTLGKLYINDELFCYTLENPWLNNAKNISCIPAGDYELTPYKSFKFGDCYILEGETVSKQRTNKQRFGVLIHAGNIEDDTHGCILVGNPPGTLGEDIAVLNSRKNFNNLMRKLNNENHILRITRQ